AVEADDLELVAVGSGRGVPHHGFPPEVAQVVLELDAEWAVIPEAVDAAVDFRGLEDEAAALAEGDQLLHQRRACRCGHRGAYLSRGAGNAKAVRRRRPFPDQSG